MGGGGEEEGEDGNGGLLIIGQGAIFGIQLLCCLVGRNGRMALLSA